LRRPDIADLGQSFFNAPTIGQLEFEISGARLRDKEQNQRTRNTKMPVSKTAKRNDARKKAEEQKAKKKAARTTKISVKNVASNGKKSKSAKRK